MKGFSGIPALELVTLTQLISRVPLPPNLYFLSLLKSQNFPSVNIEWEYEYASSGMTPFVAPGAPVPMVGIDGYGKGSAAAAYLGEKTFFQETFLNNLRMPGTHASKQLGAMQIARQAVKLANRTIRRREWCCAQMFVNGGFTYQVEGGTKFTVNYGLDTNHLITLDADRMWGTGTSRNCVEDIFDIKKMLSDDARIVLETCMLNSETLKLLVYDAQIQALAAKSQFGDGMLFANPTVSLANMFAIPKFLVYDEVFEVPAYLTAAVAASGGASYVIYVDNATDFEVGGTLKFERLDGSGKYEKETITAVDKANSTITVATGPSISFAANRDRVTMTKKFIPDNKVLFFNSSVNGMPIGEIMQAPFGIEGHYGMQPDRWEEKDPDGVYLRVEDKMLPVMYYPEAVATLTVAS